MLKDVEDYLEKNLQTILSVRGALLPQIMECAELIISALKDGHKLLIMGNGGSAADAQHFAAEMVGRFRRERRGLPAIALSTDTSALTAIGNDYGFDAVFSRQVEALAKPGDVVFGISTSGQSKNVIAAIQTATAIGCKTVGLLGKDGGELATLVNCELTVSGSETSFIQEAHIMIIHILCALIEKNVSGHRA